MAGDCCCSECPCLGDDSWKSYVQNAYAGSNEIWRQIVGSILGSTATVIVLNPLNVIKVRIQQQIATGSRGSLSIRNILLNPTRKQSMVRILWSGSSSGLVLAVPNTTTYMLAYEQCKRFFSECLPTTLHYMSPALSGALARALAVTVVSPIELARTIQTSGVNRSMHRILTDVAATHGLSGIYKGLLSTILRDCPFSAIYWSCLENMRPSIQNWFERMSPSHRDYYRKNQRFHPLSSFLAGASSGMIASLVTHPYDVLKTQQQLSLLATEKVPSSLMQVYNRHGLRGLFGGLSLRLFTVVPASAIMITIYEIWR